MKSYWTHSYYWMLSLHSGQEVFCPASGGVPAASYLQHEALETVSYASALVTIHLDYCNMFYMKLPSKKSLRNYKWYKMQLPAHWQMKAH